MLALEHRVDTYRLTVIRRSNQRRSPKAGDLITGKCEDVGKAMQCRHWPVPPPQAGAPTSLLLPLWVCATAFRPNRMSALICSSLPFSPSLLQVIHLSEKLEPLS